jgi:membrane-associated phospholipid phosphatase
VKHIPAVVLVLLLILVFWVGWQFDRDLALAARDIDPTTYAIFRQITRLGRSEWYLIPSALGIVLGFIGARRATGAARAAWERLLQRCLWVFSAVAVSGIVANILKIVFGRARPRLLDSGPATYGMSWFEVGSSYASFPSGHSNTAFAVALAIGALVPRWRVPLLIAAAVVAASRVVIGAHYLTDTLAGALLAVVTTLLLQRWFRRNGWGDLPRNQAATGSA